MKYRHLDRDVLARFDNLSAQERQEVLAHTQGCADCRRRLAEADRSYLFAALGAEAIPSAALDRLSARINDEIDRLEEVSRPGRWPAWWSIAASLLLGAIIGGFLLVQPDAPAVRRSRLSDLPGPDEPISAIEVLSSPSEAQVFDLTVGDTEIVMIFDEELDI
jgi:anti-sigma factor RsiW